MSANSIGIMSANSSGILDAHTLLRLGSKVCALAHGTHWHPVRQLLPGEFFLVSVLEGFSIVPRAGDHHSV
jgi:hypothetical protein